MTLFLDGIFDIPTSKRIPPSAIQIDYPRPVNQGGGRGIAQGLLVSEPTMSSRIRWGSILGGFENLNDLMSLLGSKDMWYWIGAGTMCWKGTDPLTTSFEFYMINYRRGLGLEQKIEDLNVLAALEEGSGLAGKSARVNVHGGYAPDIFMDSNSTFRNSAGEYTMYKDRDSNDNSGNPFRSDYLEGIGMSRSEKGTVRVRIGNKLAISQMLLQRFDVTPSLVEVEDGKALYYRVSISLVGARPLISEQVRGMYNI